MPNDNIARLLKFALKEAYIDDLMDGRFYMTAAGYNHSMPGKQYDPLKTSLVSKRQAVKSRWPSGRAAASATSTAR